MFLFLGWDGGLCGLWMDGREQKIGGGDVRAKALSWDDEWDKAKNDCKRTVPLVCHDGVVAMSRKSPFSAL